MIVPMQRVAILCSEHDRKTALARLCDFGGVHVDRGATEDMTLHAAQARLNEAQEALRLLAEARQDGETVEGCEECLATEATPDAAPPPAMTVENVLKLGAEAAGLEDEREAIDQELERLRPFGDFDPALIGVLADGGVPVTLFRMPKDAAPEAPGLHLRVLSTDPQHAYGVAIGSGSLPAAAEALPVPPRSMSAARQRRLEVCRRHLAVNRMLVGMAAGDHAVQREAAAAAEARDFAAVAASMEGRGGVVWLTGFCPAERVPDLTAEAKAHSWGILARPPRPDENPPTEIRPPRIFRPIVQLFGLLGIVPGYYEADISVVFYAFFTIFFAMLIGDAGYGLVILAATWLARRTFRKAPLAPFTLLTVFSVATIAWGVMSATYFGIPAEVLPAALRHPLSRWLAKQSNIMQFCFTLGALHLSIARLWNAVMLFPSRKFLAQIGWIGVIWTMYCASCLIVVEGFAFPGFMGPVAGVSVLMIALFMLDRSELKTSGVELAMLPLSIIGSLGDVISYVRLFAVGLAGVKVAENFNTMAGDLPLPMLVKVPAMVLILLLGHSLNLAMGALSILVHAVRLNTLEFSTHKGITWAGFAYRPFRRHQVPEPPAGAVPDVPPHGEMPHPVNLTVPSPTA